MAQIPLLSTGVPTGKAAMLKYGTINRADTVAKNLFILRKGEMLTNLGYWGNAASNAGTTATISVGLKILNNAGAALGPVFGVFITSPGSGFTSAPAISFSGGAGSGAAATSVINAAGQLVGIRMTALGTGYTSAPTVTITGGGGTNAAATAVVILSNSLLNAADVKTAATATGQQWPTTTCAAQWVPAPADCMVTGICAETGTASTSGGPWIINAYTILPEPNAFSGFFPAVYP